MGAVLRNCKLDLLEGTARYASLLLASAEGFAWVFIFGLKTYFCRGRKTQSNEFCRGY
jgi:hypothetical protein